MSKAIEDSTSTSGFSFGSLGSSMLGMLPIQAKVGAAVVIATAAVVTAAIVMAEKFQSATNKMAASAGITKAAAAQIGTAFLSTGGSVTFTAQAMMEAFGPVSGQLGLMNGKALTAGQSLAFMRSAMALAEATGESLNSTTAALAATIRPMASRSRRGQCH